MQQDPDVALDAALRNISHDMLIVGLLCYYRQKEKDVL